MTGLSLGILIGPPVGGGLYSKFGFRGPFILSIIITAVDLIGRLFIIEKAEADAYRSETESGILEAQPVEQDGPGTVGETLEMQPIQKNTDKADSAVVSSNTQKATPPAALVPRPSLSLVQVVKKLLGTSRALTVLLSTLIYGYVFVTTVA
ncbi:hypothetical protein EIP86_009821 [Pleurotus ostreatoroseus]|nr:hypothetical protein EIP86_009821 [Pleurotus ostreatoroseus]